MHSSTQIYLMFLTSMVIFGTNGVVADGIGLSSTQIVLFRSLIGGAILTLVFLATGHRYTVHKDRKKFTYLVLSGVSLGITWILLYKSFGMVGVGASYAEYYCAPILFILLSPILFREKLGSVAVLGFIIVIAGSLVTCCSMMGAGGDPVGHLYGLGSALSQTCVLVFGRLASGNDPLENCSLQLMFASGTISVFSVLTDDLPDVGAIRDWDNILVLGAVNTAFCYFLYLTSIVKMSVQSSSALGYLEMVSSVLFAALLLGEQFTSGEAVGIMMILLGATVNSFGGKHRRRKSATAKMGPIPKV